MPCFFRLPGYNERKTVKEHFPMTIEELKESLLASPKNGYNLLTAEQKA